MEKQQPSWRHSLTQQKLLESVCSGMKAAVHQQSGRSEGKQWCEASLGARWEPLLCFGWLWHCRAEPNPAVGCSPASREGLLQNKIPTSDEGKGDGKGIPPCSQSQERVLSVRGRFGFAAGCCMLL